MSQVPATVLPGQHKLVIEGSLHRNTIGSGQPIFRNQTVLAFESKYVSLFIQTSRPIYHFGQRGWCTTSFDTVCHCTVVQGDANLDLNCSFSVLNSRLFSISVNFRIVGVKPGSLKPATGDMTIYVRVSKSGRATRKLK